MIASEKQLLEFTARIVYNIDGLSPALKFFFHQYITFHFQGKLSSNQIEDIENRKASKVFKGASDIELAAAALNLQDKLWVIASLQLLQTEAEHIDDRIVSRRIGKRISDLIRWLGLESEVEKIAEARSKIDAEAQRFQHRPVIKIPISLTPLTIDYCLRWIVLIALNFSGQDFTLVTITTWNYAGIPIIIFIISYFIGKGHSRYNANLLQTYGGEHNFKIERVITVRQYTWLAIYLGTSIFIGQLMPEPFGIGSLLVSFVAYYAIYIRYLRIGKISENELVRQLEKENLDTSRLTVDQNDEVIVQLETNLNSATGRLEAYVLESALFGALSFSGFLQIMATELISFKDLENFAKSIFDFSQAFIHFDWPELNQAIVILNSKQSLFCLISVESLICSIFFLAVIASRLRFSDIADQVRTALNMAKAFNEKEERLADEHGTESQQLNRIQELTKRVNDQLGVANRVLEQINPIMIYMIYFRNAGIMVFVIILISSSLFISGALSWIFIGLVISTLLYFNRNALTQTAKAYLLEARILFTKRDYWFFFLATLPIAIGYLLRIFFHIWETNWLVSMSIFLLGLFTFIWLLIAAHVDENFGEIDMNPVKLARWRFVKALVAFFILIASVFMAINAEEANAMLEISLLAIAILMYFVGYYLTKKWWHGIITGWVIAVSCVGILFKILYLEGANMMIIMAFLGFLILIPFLIIKRQLFHKLLLRFCLAGFLLSACFFLDIRTSIPLKIRLAYEHATPQVNRLVKIIGFYEQLEEQDDVVMNELPKIVDAYMVDLDKYINQYGTSIGFTTVHERVLWYNLVRFSEGELDMYKQGIRTDFRFLYLAKNAMARTISLLQLFQFHNLSPEFRDPDYLIHLIDIQVEIYSLLNEQDQLLKSLQSWSETELPSAVTLVINTHVNKLNQGNN